MAGSDGDDEGDADGERLSIDVVLQHTLVRNDNPSALDLLGFEDVVDVLEEIALREDLDPVTIGINAPWGGGKTTLLRLLEAKLADRADVLCIFVSPWEYDNKTDPTTALIDEVLGRLDAEIAKVAPKQPLKDALSALRKRVHVAKAIKLAATAALTVALPSPAALLNLFQDETTDDPAPDPSLQGFREEFATLMADEGLSELKRVIVLVDDLDRSLPDTVVETLEAIKLFLSVQKMAFVIAADEDNVTNAISRRLATTGQPTTALQYLEKIVQVPIRVPALTKVQTEEYLGLLMVEDLGDDPLAAIRSTRPQEVGHLIERLAACVPDERLPFLELAERLAPLLHQQAAGNPRRLKRFLNAYWLRVSLTSRRGLDLDAMVMAKLMLAELHYPELFGLMLSWLAAGNVPEKIGEIEQGASDQGELVHRWGQLEPPIAGLDLSGYLQLAASLRGETVEVAMLPEGLRALASDLGASSDTKRSQAIAEAQKLAAEERTVLASYLAQSLRQQRSPESQKAVADAISGLCGELAEANTAVEELRRMPHGAITVPVPLALVGRSAPEAFKDLLREWATSPDVTELVRNASLEALKDD